jgi:hypothetical protein
MSSRPVRLSLIAMLATLAWSAPTTSHAAVKIGLDQVQLDGATYTHDTAGTKLTNAKTMVGTQLALEFSPSEHFGFEIDTSLSPLERSYQLGTNGATSNNVSESASYTLYGVNLYFNRDDRRGFHPVLGVATGQLSVTQKFEGGTVGTKSSHSTVDINVLRAGFDWMTSYAGLRLQYQLWTGDKSNTTQVTGVRQTNSYTGSAILLGVFAAF